MTIQYRRFSDVAKAKKKKDNKKRKYSGPKKIFSIRSLEEIVSSVEQKQEAGESASAFDEKLCFAAKQALQFIESSAKHGIKLDLSKDSEYYFAGALMALGLDKQEEGKPEEQIKIELSEVAGSYLLFEQINMLWTKGAIGDIWYDEEFSNNVVIKAHAVMKTKIALFDVYDAMSKVADQTFIFKDVTPSKLGVEGSDADKTIRGLAVNLNPISVLVQNELLYKL